MMTRWVAAAAAMGMLVGCAKDRDGRNVTSLDSGWQFARGDVGPGADHGAATTRASVVSVPHDWSIAGPVDQRNVTGGGGGYAPSGVSWYWRDLGRGDAFAGKHVCVEFDGVMANAEVWLNGVKVGGRPFGYESFAVDLTGKLAAGSNWLAVKADTSAQPASRWYTGAGIYRPVRLVVTSPAHVVRDGVFVTTPSVSAGRAVVKVSVEVVGDGEGVARVKDSHGVVVGTCPLRGNHGRDARDTGGASDGVVGTLEGEVEVARPALWDIGHGAMYSAEVELSSAGRVVDRVTVPFGIRECRFEAGTGFWINGRNVKLKGVAVHQDGGAVGAAVPSAVWAARLGKLGEIGANAIRTAHNPPDPKFLEACDRMGFVVMDEMFDCWRVGKNRNDYHLVFDQWSKQDTADNVRRDRNHPSVVLWSAGNEIHDTPNAESAKAILRGLVETFHANDPTRPVTQALFRPNVSHDYDDGLADLLDVVGQNYRENELAHAADQKRTRKIIGTENQHGRPVWLALRDDPRMAGQFLWTGVDYLGEAGAWPRIGSGSGLLDRTGVMKPMAYERQSWWSEKPMVYACRRVSPRQLAESDPGYTPGANTGVTATRPRDTLFEDWTPTDQRPHEETVEVYSNCGSVELFLNGKSLGKQAINRDASPRVWRVGYEPGTLRAVGDGGGNEGVSWELKTAGAAAGVEVITERPMRGGGMFDDVTLAWGRVVDAQGVTVPAAANLVRFSAAGGQVIGVDSGSPYQHESFAGDEVRAYRGRAMAVVRGGGDVRAALSSEGK